jgi:hypothetical protein
MEKPNFFCEGIAPKVEKRKEKSVKFSISYYVSNLEPNLAKFS